ncbi:MAG: hypothetical protein LBR47_03470 [Spirochaetaceae bacterium]|nr:hypothetical protein [Spirochaetaceae bacterium]
MTIQYIAAFAVCLVFGFFSPVAPELLDSFITKWKVYTGLLLFISVMPALQISGILAGYSWAFGRTQKAVSAHWRPVFPVYIRGVIKITLICLTLVIIGTELAAPMLRISKNRMTSSSREYTECIRLTREYIDTGDVSMAVIYLERAKLISLEEPEIAPLFAELEYAYLQPSFISKKDESPVSAPSPTVTEAEEIPPSVDDMYDRALRAFNEGRYFDAHYYAAIAAEFADPRNPRNRQALELASKAWNILNDPVISDMDGESMALFARKREGYRAITNGEYLEAYYIFRDLSRDYSDPDITRYFEIASKNLVKTHFFIDETYNIEAFEAKHNIYFSLPRPDGSHDIVYIEGIAYSGELGEAVQYLRNFYFTRTDPQDKLEYSLHVPFAKMIATPASAIDPDMLLDSTPAALNGVPKLLLHAVDREEQGTEILPVYSYYVDGELVSSNTYPPAESYGDILVLVMPFDDINLIAEAVYGPESMSITSLWKFSRKAADYGYSAELYHASLIRRISFPLLLFILSILSATGGWNYRFKSGAHFRFLWILLIPLFTVIAYFVILFAKYILDLIILTVTAAALSFALPVTITILVILCFFAAMLFVSRRE